MAEQKEGNPELLVKGKKPAARVLWALAAGWFETWRRWLANTNHVNVEYHSSREVVKERLKNFTFVYSRGGGPILS